MKFSQGALAAAAFFFNSVTASPITHGGNETTLLVQRDTPSAEVIVSKMKWFAEYSASAYCNSEPSLFGTRVTCSNDACPAVSASNVWNYAYLGFSQAQVEGFISVDYSNKLLVVSYAGTTTPFNLIADLLIPMESCEDLAPGTGCKAHQGFYYAWGDVKTNTMTAIKAAVATYQGFQVIVTGHSLGGAVATIAGAHIRKAGIPCDIYSFGSPRVGNEAFVNFVGAQAGHHYRVTHQDDPIPRFPGRSLGYFHTSPEYWLWNGDATKIDYGVADITVCTGTTNGNCNAGTNSLSTTAHSYYFRKVSACK